MRNYAATCKGICSYNLLYNFLIQLLPLLSLYFVVNFSNAFWHENKSFLKASFQNEIVPLLVIFHLLYSLHRDVKICFYSCRYQNQNFSVVSQSCRSCSPSVLHSFCTRVTRVSLVSHSCHSCCIRVALVLLVSDTRVVKQTRSLPKGINKKGIDKNNKINNGSNSGLDK